MLVKEKLRELITKEIELVKIIWNEKRQECLEGGRDLVRLIIQICRHNEFEFLRQSLAEEYGDQKLISYIMNKGIYRDTNQSPYIKFMIPSSTEEKLNFLLSKVVF